MGSHIVLLKYPRLVITLTPLRIKPLSTIVPSHSLILAFTSFRSEVTIHKHSACQLVISLDDSFVCDCDHVHYPEVYGFVIQPQVAHACYNVKGKVLILNIEPYSDYGKSIFEKLKNNKARVFTKREEMFRFFGFKNAVLDLNTVLSALSTPVNMPNMDQRVIQICAYINHHFANSAITSQVLADHVFLSPSRMTALFKQQTGSSISKYLLWTRLKNAAHQILLQPTSTITEIAHQSGFYDSAQFTKYMHQLFGLSPSKLKQKSELIQVLDMAKE